MLKQVTNNEIFESIKDIVDSVKDLKNDVVEIKGSHFEFIEFLQEHMVTKEELRSDLGQLNHNLRDYIDRKIYDLRGDLVQIGVLKRA